MAATEIVIAKYNDTFWKVAESYQNTKQHLENIEGFLTSLSPIELQAIFNRPEFVRYILSTGTKPEAPTISFPEMTVPDVDVVIPGFDYTDSPYSSELREALKTELIDGVENGGTGLGPEIEEAIFERDRLRREQARQDALDAAAATWSDESGDLGLPDGALAATLLAIHTEHLQKEQTVSFDTATKMAELARAQQEVYLKVGTELENVMGTKHTADQLRALEAAKVLPEIIIRGIEAALAKVKVMGEVYQALAAKAAAQAAVYDTQMKGYLADVEVGSKELDASVKKYTADIQGAQAESEANSRTDTLRVEKLKNDLLLGMEGLKTIAQLSAQMVAAFATSVSASASVGDQESYSRNESESESVNTSFIHNYDHETS